MAIFNSKLKKIGYFDNSSLDKNVYKKDTRSNIHLGCSAISGVYLIPVVSLSLGRNFKLGCQVCVALLGTLNFKV